MLFGQRPDWVLLEEGPLGAVRNPIAGFWCSASNENA
jgi:hypothetical protein